MLTQETNSFDGFNYDMRIYFDCSFIFPHLHRSSEFIHVIKGSIKMMVNGNQSTLSAGDSLLVLPYRLHSFESAPGTISIVHVFSRECAPDFFRLLGNRSAADPRFCCPDGVISFYMERFGADKVDLTRHSHETVHVGHTNKFSSEKNNGTHRDFDIPPHTRLKLISALECVLAEFLGSAAIASGSDGTLMERVLSYIGDNFAEELTLSSAAAAIGYDQHYLCRCLRNQCGMSFHSLLNSFRVERAKEFLDNHELPATEISHLCGFGSLRSFNRVFREATGMSPTEYRKK